MNDNLIELDFHGIHVVGPEGFACAVLVWQAENRILPVWLSPIDAAELGDRSLDEESDRRRPSARDVLADVLSRFDGGVEQLALTSYFEGVFIAEITTVGGEQIDARPSDILILSEILDLPIVVAEDVLTQASMHINESELREYIDIELSDSSSDDEGAAEVSSGVDDEFRRMLEEMGMEDPGDTDDSGSDTGDDPA